MTALTLALSKGRILEESLPLLAAVGLDPAGDIDRLLRVPSKTRGISLLIIRPTDVPTYVSHGAADLGIVGKDVLMENGSGDLYEPLDLDIAKCRLSVAAVKDAPARDPRRRLRVATKYPEIARRHFADKGEQVEIIKLYGSMELAPLVGLADAIVDVVSTGGTLRANGLVAVEDVMPVSSRLIVNQAALKTRAAVLQPILDAFEHATPPQG